MSLQEKALLNEQALKENAYPGRGIIIGSSPDERNFIQVYWIMGRSNNSRNRIFEMDGSFVRTKAFDESALEDPSLIIYYPIRDLKYFHVVSNGDQTDTIYEFLKAGSIFEEALTIREFEPDGPHYTPRISGLIDLSKKSYKLSILKTIDNNAKYSQKNVYNYETFIPGLGHCIHTYEENSNPLKSFQGEPRVVRMFDSIDETAEYYWNLLNEENRISLLVKYIDKETGNFSYKIINKNS